jgi:hypothetical protein
MSTRARPARLERLERLARASQPGHLCPDFVIPSWHGRSSTITAA